MKRVVIRYGLIGAAMVVAFMFGAYPFWKSGTFSFENGMFVGYTSMLISLSVIFFGIKSYRDRELGGSITFGRGFLLGMLITAVATVAYSTGWEVYMKLLAPDFIHQYADFTISKARAAGAGEQELKEITARMNDAIEMYNQPLLRFLMTMMEILPVGVLISLVSAAVLRKKEILNSQPL